MLWFSKIQSLLEKKRKTCIRAQYGFKLGTFPGAPFPTPFLVIGILSILSSICSLSVALLTGKILLESSINIHRSCDNPTLRVSFK